MKGGMAMSVPVFFKATRLDGTDFRTGTVRYEVGRRVRPLPLDGERRLCGPGYLHAADVPAEALVGGRWPCRLFEVTGTPAVGFDETDPHKGGFKQLTVVWEIEAWRALGPNGREVAALIDRAGKLTGEELEALSAGWAATRGAPWDAWRAARGAARGAARDAARGAARDAARKAAWGAAQTAGRDIWGSAAWGAAQTAGRDIWGSAAWEAAVALVVRDLISREQFDLLYGPWAKVIGKPV